MHSPRPWLSPVAAERESAIVDSVTGFASDELRRRIDDLVERNLAIHERECVNLNPATNVMSPRAEAAMAARLGSRPSLGHAGEKYEMGLEAIEELEVITTELACRVFDAAFAEVRVASGAMANLYTFMATCRPGDAVIVPPPAVGGHVTHNRDGAAGLYGLQIHEAPVDADSYTVDVAGVRRLAEEVRPALITIGSSFNLEPHPVAELRAVADEVGAALLFDAAHLCGLFAGRAWPNPLDQGAHVMTLSTYKSLAGPPGGLLLTNDAAIAERLDAIAHPGLTANFDAGKTTALAICLLDWVDHGAAYAAEMRVCAAALARELQAHDLPVYGTRSGLTSSHQLALRGEDWGGGHPAAVRLREANILTSAIGLPDGEGVRMGTPEVVRWGMVASDMPALATLVASALRDDPASVAPDVTAFRAAFDRLHFCS